MDTLWHRLQDIIKGVIEGFDHSIFKDLRIIKENKEHSNYYYILWNVDYKIPVYKGGNVHVYASWRWYSDRCGYRPSADCS